MRKRISLNDGFWYSEGEAEEYKKVRIPHAMAVTPLNYFDESIYQKKGVYKRSFMAEEDWLGKHVLMTVGGAAHTACVILNGEKLAEHRCGYTAFTVDLSQHLKWEVENELVITVDSRESQNIPPFGNVIDYMTYGGIYREVYLEITERSYIEDVSFRSVRIDDSTFDFYTETKLRGTDGTYLLKQTLLARTGEKQNIVKQITAEAAISGGLGSMRFESRAENIKAWRLEAPELYELQTELIMNNNEAEKLDSQSVRVGFRSAEFKRDGFYLNGEKIKLRGLNRHQSYPYVGYAMPKSMQEFDAELLKNELAVNAVRTSHYPQSQHFVNRCDEIGLLVFTEIPGWQYIGDEEWREQAKQNTKDMVMQYRNHASVVLWGVRINESVDDDELYRETNRIAHECDESRQTSGVRYLERSSLLEDVYAFNDFSHDGTNDGCKKKKSVTSDMKRGYLISEFNGHMFPTKSFDCEDRLTEQLKRHAGVMNAYYKEKDIAGGFGWCMFDYNTHKDFGSGDRICYHGVMDMFRNPKPVAELYLSQQDSRPVLYVSSDMDIGEHNACYIKEVYAVTNADLIKLYRNDELVRTYTRADTLYGAMPHGPILIDDFVGELIEKKEGYSHRRAETIKRVLLAANKYGLSNLPFNIKLLAAKCILIYGMKFKEAVELYNRYVGSWGGSSTTYRFEAYKDGRLVKTVEKEPMHSKKLLVTVSHTRLIEAETYDVAEVRFKLVSEKGNLLRFAGDIVTLKTSGGIELIGPSQLALCGGMGGAYIRSLPCGGEGELLIATEEEELKVSFFVEIRQTEG